MVLGAARGVHGIVSQEGYDDDNFTCERGKRKSAKRGGEGKVLSSFLSFFVYVFIILIIYAL